MSQTSAARTGFISACSPCQKRCVHTWQRAAPDNLGAVTVLNNKGFNAQRIASPSSKAIRHCACSLPPC